jgi:hypothetical protein
VLTSGLIIQVGVALGIAALIRWILRAADRVAVWSSGARPRLRGPLAIPVPASPHVPSVLLPASVGGRAPPRSR